MYSKSLLTIILAAATAVHATCPSKEFECSNHEEDTETMESESSMASIDVQSSLDSTPFDQTASAGHSKEVEEWSTVHLTLFPPSWFTHTKAQDIIALPTNALRPGSYLGAQVSQTTIMVSLSISPGSPTASATSTSTTSTTVTSVVMTTPSPPAPQETTVTSIVIPLINGQSSWWASQASVQEGSASYFSSVGQHDHSIYAQASASLRSKVSELTKVTGIAQASQSELSALAKSLRSEASVASVWAHSHQSVASSSARVMRQSAAAAGPKDLNTSVAPRHVQSWFAAGIVAAVASLGLAVGL